MKTLMMRNFKSEPQKQPNVPVLDYQILNKLSFRLIFLEPQRKSGKKDMMGSVKRLKDCKKNLKMRRKS